MTYVKSDNTPSIHENLPKRLDWIEDGIANSGGTVQVTDGTHSVAAATEIDFTSGATVTDAGGGIANVAINAGSVSPLTTKGDVWGFSTVNARIPIGADGNVLTADSTQALGVKWANVVPDTLHTVASSTASLTIDYSTADVWDITLTANCTFTLQGFTTGKPDYLTLVLRQDSTGSRTVTWPTITWIGSGIAPILQTAANSVDSVVLFSFDGGTTVYGIAQTSASGLRSGTSFPGSPSDGDLFYRTDRRILYEYDATSTNWLSLDRKYVSFGIAEQFDGVTTTSTSGRIPVFEDVYVEKFVVRTFVVTTNNTSNYWTVKLNKQSAAGANTTVTSIATNLDSTSTWTAHDVSVAATISSASFPVAELDLAKTGTPGAIYLATYVVVRSVG